MEKLGLLSKCQYSFITNGTIYIYPSMKPCKLCREPLSAWVCTHVHVHVAVLVAKQQVTNSSSKHCCQDLPHRLVSFYACTNSDIWRATEHRLAICAYVVRTHTLLCLHSFMRGLQIIIIIVGNFNSLFWPAYILDMVWSTSPIKRGNPLWKLHVHVHVRGTCTCTCTVRLLSTQT